MTAPLLMLSAIAAASHAPFGEQELRSTVTVSGPCTSECPSGNLSFGAGEIIGRRSDGALIVLTARHVAENASSLDVFVRNDAEPGIEFDAFARESTAHRATVVAYAANVDLALLAFAPGREDDYAFAPIPTGDGEFSALPGVVVGDPNGSLWTASPYTFIGSAATTFDLDCRTCGPGDSGGGVFDATGRLLGIVVQQRVGDDDTERTSEFQAISLAELHAFLRIAGEPFASSQPREESVSNAWRRFDAMRGTPAQ